MDNPGLNDRAPSKPGASSPRPALAAALGLLCGVTSGDAVPLMLAVPLGLGLAMLSLGWPRLSRPLRAGVAAVGFFLLGTSVVAMQGGPIATAPTSGPNDEAGLFEGHVCGTVSCLPERDLEGAWYFEIDGTVELNRQRSCNQQMIAAADSRLRLQIKVYPSPPDALIVLESLEVGDVVRLWCRIRRPSRAGNPGSSDPLRRLQVNGLDGFGSVKSARLVERRDRGHPRLTRFAGRLRVFARQRLDSALGNHGPRRGLAGAILLGDRRGMPAEVTQSLRRAGLSHLISISGLHVGILISGVVFALRRAGVHGWLLCAVTVPFLVMFVLVVGSRPSVMRAAAAAILILVARSSGRDGDSLNGLAVIFILLVAEHPQVVGDVGFQLTFLATAGILAFAASCTKLLPIPRGLGGGCAVSLTAYAATAPAVARHFGMLAPVGLLSNLVAVPLCGLLLMSGYATIISSSLGPVGALCRAVLVFALDGILVVGHVFGDSVDGSFHVPAPSFGALAVCYSALAAMYVGCVSARRPTLDGVFNRVPVGGRVQQRLIALVTALALAWIHLGPPPPRGDGRSHAALIDVGQGQSLAVRGPRAATVLIDAGGAYGSFDPGEREVVPFLLNWSGRRVDCLVLSHAHLDHAAGALAVIRSLEVGELWVGPELARSDRLQAISDAVRESGGSVVLVRRGHDAFIGGMRLRVLSPMQNRAGVSENADSLVVLVGREPARILVPGDIGAAIETVLVASGPALLAEALVLSHHGSRDGSTEAFLDRVAPDVALVSCGRRNPFGHPNGDVLARIAARGIVLYRTDLEGLIELDETESGWKIRGSESEGR